VESLRSVGFINYFGLQRFGNCKNSKTHEIGRLIVAQNYSEAFKTILLQDNGMADVTEAKRRYAEDFDHDALLRKLPRSCVLSTDQFIERAMVEGLKRTGGTKNWLQALLAIPRNIRNLYPHAYQSYIWNKVASQRVEQHGHKLGTLG